MKNYIKIYGERNCGTNYLYSLLAANLDCTILGGTVPSYFRSLPDRLKDTYFTCSKNKSLGWKHGFPVADVYFNQFAKKRNLLVITITKSPYAFLNSSYKRPYGMLKNNVESFSEFLRADCDLKGRENYRGNPITPLELWNKKNRAYLDLAKLNINCINLTYEGLLQNPKQLISDLNQDYGFDLISEFKNIEQGTKIDSNKSFQSYKEKYLNPAWEGVMTHDDIQYINSIIDTSVMDDLGYTEYKNS